MGAQALCVSVCRTNSLEWQHIKSKETAMLHVLFVIAFVPLFLYLGFVALLVFVKELMK